MGCARHGEEGNLNWAPGQERARPFEAQGKRAVPLRVKTKLVWLVGSGCCGVGEFFVFADYRD
jgi:hypothetical protein